MKTLLKHLVLLSLVLSLGACESGTGSRYSTKTEENQDGTLLRADPGYLQYMEKQSMLRNSVDLTKIVSGSNLGWRNPGSAARPTSLLEGSSVWMRVHPQTVLVPGNRSPFMQLAGNVVWTALGKAGINGMYVAPVGGSGALWDSKRSFEMAANEDVIQYAPPKTTGKDEDYKALSMSLSSQGHMLGSDLVPAASGIGPDFYLAMRNYHEYPGIFCMMRVPKELWDLLPKSKQEDDIFELNGTQAAALASKGVIPTTMGQDGISFMPKTGWAATGEVRGIDGNLQRWVYRYYENPKRPILNWADPSASARQILNGSVIRQVGMMGTHLNGFRVMPLVGLDNARGMDGGVSSTDYYTAKEAALNLSRQIRSYGGWSWMRDSMPFVFMAEMLGSGPDFITDSVSSPAAEHALLTGNAELLRQMLDAGIARGLSFKNLMHDSTAFEGVDYTLPQLQYSGNTALAGAAISEMHAVVAAAMGNEDQIPIARNILYSTPAALSAMALKINPTGTISTEQTAAIRKGHQALIFYKAMQPGGLMLSSQDLVGLMPISWKSMTDSEFKWNVRLANMSAMALLSSSESVMVNVQGLPRGNSLYGPLDEQTYNEDSFMQAIGEIINVRNHLKIDEGTLVARLHSTGKGVVALATRLPGKNAIAVAITNFSRDDSMETLDLSTISGLPAGGTRIEYGVGSAPGLQRNGTRLDLTIRGWGTVLVVLGN